MAHSVGVSRSSSPCRETFRAMRSMVKAGVAMTASPEREALQALIDKTQEHVTGTVRVKLYKGSARTVARWSDHSLYSEKHVTFEEDAGAYDQKDAEGFIRLNALRLRLIASRNARVAKT